MHTCNKLHKLFHIVRSFHKNTPKEFFNEMCLSSVLLDTKLGNCTSKGLWTYDAEGVTLIRLKCRPTEKFFLTATLCSKKNNLAITSYCKWNLFIARNIIN